ncbi:Oxoglutarate/iron-dependent dioxygenase [Macleaya cordata]|uniref:Oxoglutarate/iron-dependent dioxygenase n=1 Tax=Macleaya cordata TaxID=56857 RepID=A0A200QEI1_MACCD|nr:Oxoglutarate/iron-dependent dioxygenase [Macleaya cordata]
MEEEMKNLKGFKVGSLPTLFYIPNFISDSEQVHLIHQIYQSPISKWKSLKNRRLQNWGGVVHEKGLLPQNLPPWLTKITKRICEETGLFPSPINHVLINEYLPDQGIMPHQDGPAYFPVVAILSLGSPAVMNFTPHSRLKESSNTGRNTAEDTNSDKVEAYNEADVCSDIHQPSSILLMPCSLLIFKDEAYSDYLHGIEDNNVHQLDKAVNIVEALEHHSQDPSLLVSEDTLEANCAQQFKSIQRTSTRISLTCRVVLKVHRNLFKF